MEKEKLVEFNKELTALLAKYDVALGLEQKIVVKPAVKAEVVTPSDESLKA